MKRFVKSLAFVLVMVMCIGMLAACGDDTDATNPSATKPSGTEPTGTTAPAYKDVVGIVTDISDTFVAVDICMKSAGTVNLEKLDQLVQEPTGEIDYIYLSTSTLYGYYADGEVKSLKKADVSIGDLIVVTTNSKNVPQIVILNYEPETPTDPTENTGAAE